MQTTDSLSRYKIIDKDMAKDVLNHIISLLKEDLKEFSHSFKNSHSENRFYKKTENIGWTTGFWTGQLWLAYEESKDEEFKKSAMWQVDSFLQRIIDKVDVNHHDMGFLYSLSCMPAIRLENSEKAEKALVLAADNLISRFHEKGEFIQAWGDLGASDNYRLIIDCLLNVPLLYRASELTGDGRYEDYGKRHVKTAMKYVIRDDYSTYHTYYFDKDTGLPVKGVTHQGNRDESAWSRGQAWGIYGAALSYAKLRDETYLEIFENLSKFFIEHLPDDLVPYWDFDFDTGSDEPRDSSSSAIVACGMLEMAKYMNEEKAKYYKELAGKLIYALCKHCLVKSKEESNGLLLHGTYAKSTATNPCPNLGVDECVIWGDYYFMEALVRILGDWNPYW